jgi:hypothetical protein
MDGAEAEVNDEEKQRLQNHITELENSAEEMNRCSIKIIAIILAVLSCGMSELAVAEEHRKGY